MTQYSVLLYRVRNLGDMIQTVALSRLLPQTAGVYRHRLDDAVPDRLLIVNGLLDKDLPPRPGGASCLFAGVSGPHFHTKAYLRWMAASRFPIGARDPYTMNLAVSAGLQSVCIGCATLTLPRYDGPRSGVYSVDSDGPGRQLSHEISRSVAVERQWEMALEALERYRTAEAVYTSRLHVALPCLAYGTPVRLANPIGRAWKPNRYSITEEIGLRYDTLMTIDVTSWRKRYLEFLEVGLSNSITPSDPTMPSVGARADLSSVRLPWRSVRLPWR